MISDKEIMEKGIRLLEENLGKVETTRFISNIMQEGRNSPKNYTEWRRENLFENLSEEDFLSDLKTYAKANNL